MYKSAKCTFLCIKKKSIAEVMLSYWITVWNNHDLLWGGAYESVLIIYYFIILWIIDSIQMMVKRELKQNSECHMYLNGVHL